jgi:hypothetical protein
VDNLLPDVGALVIQINSSEFSLYMTVYSSMAVINLLDATEDASAHSFGRNIAKEPMTMFSHEINARMLGQTVLYLMVFVGRIVIADQVQFLLLGCLPLDATQEPQPLL